MGIGTPVSAAPNPNIAAALAAGVVHVENQIDLGGGSAILPYAANDKLNQRVYEMVGAEVPTEAVTDGRIKECGLILTVGRAGIYSNFGCLPFGTVIKFGIYRIFGLGFFGDAVELFFEDRKPMVPDLNDHYSLDQRVQLSPESLATLGADTPYSGVGYLQGL